MLRRQAVDLTQQELADAVGVTARTVQRWEAGDKMPSLTPLQFWKLCQLLKCSAEDLARDFFPEAFDSDEEIAAESPGDLAPN